MSGAAGLWSGSSLILPFITSGTRTSFGRMRELCPFLNMMVHPPFSSSVVEMSSLTAMGTCKEFLKGWLITLPDGSSSGKVTVPLPQA